MIVYTNMGLARRHEHVGLAICLYLVYCQMHCIRKEIQQPSYNELSLMMHRSLCDYTLAPSHFQRRQDDTFLHIIQLR